MIENKNVIKLEKSQIKSASKTFALAFYDEPHIVYLIPDSSKRNFFLSHFFEFRLKYGLLYGEIYATSENLEGVAMWLPSKNAKLTPWKLIRAGAISFLSHIFFSMNFRILGRLRYISSYTYSIHNHYVPYNHCFLSLIGVDPKFQGNGFAGILLRDMLAKLDQNSVSCYVETTNEKYISFYENFGFTTIKDTYIPKTNIRLVAMVRTK